MGVFDFGGFAVEDHAEGVEGIVGGEDVAGAEDGIQEMSVPNAATISSPF